MVAKANQYARDHGLAQFVIYQGKWSVLSRDLERDLLPLARHDGLAIAAWGAVGQGRFQRKADRGASKDGRSALPLTDKEVAASDALEVVADELGVQSVTAVALAYIFAKYPYVYPIVGGRKVEQLHENLTALDIKLSQKQVRFLDGALPFDYGEPTASVSQESGVKLTPRSSGWTPISSGSSSTLQSNRPGSSTTCPSRSRWTSSTSARATRRPRRSTLRARTGRGSGHVEGPGSGLGQAGRVSRSLGVSGGGLITSTRVTRITRCDCSSSADQAEPSQLSLGGSGGGDHLHPADQVDVCLRITSGRAGRQATTRLARLRRASAPPPKCSTCSQSAHCSG